MRNAPGHFDGDGCTFPTLGHLLPNAPMRVLSVRQPWAWALIHGQKDVENRSRSLGPYRGPVAIQASLTYDEDAVVWHGGPLAVDESGDHREPRGSIIGVVDLVDVHHFAECVSIDDYHEDEDGNEVGRQGTYACSPWAEQGNVYHLVLANPRPLSDPFPYRGGLGLRTLPADVETELLRRLG